MTLPLPAAAHTALPASIGPDSPPLSQRWVWYRQFGYNPSSLGALGAEVFTVSGIEGGLGHHTAGRVWIGTGDPLCAPGDQAALLTAFVAGARARGNLAVLLPVAARLAAAPPSLRAVTLGATPYLDFQHWSPAGNRGKMLRGNLGKARRLGVQLESTGPTPAFRTECAALMRAWQAQRRAGTALGWVFDLDPFA